MTLGAAIVLSTCSVAFGVLGAIGSSWLSKRVSPEMRVIILFLSFVALGAFVSEVMK
jgi:hypothetical protein